MKKADREAHKLVDERMMLLAQEIENSNNASDGKMTVEQAIRMIRARAAAYNMSAHGK